MHYEKENQQINSAAFVIFIFRRPCLLSKLFSQWG